jgi:cobalamin biosynthesis protein CobD/CbiB
METQDFTKLTDEELLVEKKKLKKSKIFFAGYIGFMIGILIFGVAAWSLSQERQLGFLLPMLIPISIIYKLVKNSKQNQPLEQALKQRNIG